MPKGHLATPLCFQTKKPKGLWAYIEKALWAYIERVTSST